MSTLKEKLIENRKLYKIGHYHTEWLPNTMTWLYRLISDLDRHVWNSVFVEKLYPNHSFPFNSLYSFDSESPHIQLLDRLLKKSGIKSSLRSMVNHMIDNDIQLLHSHFGHIGITGAVMAKELDIPHVVSFYGMDVHQIPRSNPSIRSRYESLFEQSCMIFCEGPFMAKSLFDMGAPSNKVIIHPLGVDTKNIEFINRIPEPETIRILIAASFRQKKGIPLALKALGALKNKISFRISIVGDAGSDERSRMEKKLIMDIIKEENLQELVDLRGFMSHTELMKLAGEHDIFLQPSIHADDGDCEGGLPVSLIEMAAAGLTVIGSDHCDIPQLIHHGNTGYMATEGDYVELANIILESVSQTEKWDQIRKNARHLVETTFDSVTQSRSLADRYGQILG